METKLLDIGHDWSVAGQRISVLINCITSPYWDCIIIIIIVIGQLIRQKWNWIEMNFSTAI